MKSSLIWAIIGFLVILFSGIIELKYLTNLSDEFINLLTEIDNYEEVDKKTEEVTNFRKKWDKHKRILSMFIDHIDIHKIESILVETETILKNNLDISQISTNFAILKLYIDDIKDERTFTLKNVL